MFDDGEFDWDLLGEACIWVLKWMATILIVGILVKFVIYNFP